MGRVFRAARNALAERGRRRRQSEDFADARTDEETDVRRARLESMGRDPLAVQKSLIDVDEDRPPR